MIVNISAFVVIGVFSLNLLVVNAWLDSSKFDEKIFALIKVLEYMKKRPDQMNVDTTFGVTSAEANLQAALEHSNFLSLKPYQKEFLEKTWELSQATRTVLYISEKSSNEDIVRLSAMMNRPEIWVKPITWKKMLLENSFLPSADVTVAEVEKSMFDGHPKAEESDLCLLELAENCQLTDKCRELVVNDNSSSTAGYPLTHRLLIKQAISAFQCNTSISRFLPYLGYNLCYLILHDLITIETMGFPDIGRDLALEQIFLCGMEGYLDFVTEHYERLVLDWQHESGCYKGLDDLKSRKKRAGDYTDFGCINHTTGLAAAALALMIRKDVDTMTTP